MDGLRFVGPFEDAEEANNYVDTTAWTSEWWVTKLVAPS